MIAVRRGPGGVRIAPAFALLSAMVVAACNGAPGGSSAPASGQAVTTAPAATSTTPASPMTGGDVSITSILGKVIVPPPSTTWIRVSDPAAPFSYEVPAAWTMHSAYPWQQGGATVGIALAAGVDLSKLSVDFSLPGVVVGVSGATNGLTPRQVVEGGASFSTCTAGPVQEVTDAGTTVAYQLWTSCGGNTGILLVMAIAAAGQAGLVGIVFQGASEADLGYLDHIVPSLAATAVQATPAPAATGGSVSGPTYTISMDVCQNQHGQGVSGGLIRNDDSLIHSYRIVVAFSDPNGVFLNDTGWTTSDLQPGITARWQATVPSGLPAVSVSCQITRVELVR